MRKIKAEFLFLLFITAGSLLIVMAYQFLQSDNASKSVAVNTGPLDLVFANNGMPNQICLSSGGSAPFSKESCNGFDTEFTESNDVALGDFNNDGHLDVVFANYTYDDPGISGARNRVCLNDGTGNFSCDFVSLISLYSHAVAVGDVNNDNNLDVVFANDPNRDNDDRANNVCLGDGMGAFTCHNIHLPQYRGEDVELGDFNEDGNLDAVFATFYDQVGQRICLGDGTGNFKCQMLSTDIFPIEFGLYADVAIGDVNNDGHLDTVFAFTDDHDKVCLGNGHAEFSCHNASSTKESSAAVALGDLNNDGYLDALFAGDVLTHTNSICLGNGSGTFACKGFELGPFGTFVSATLADLNGDGILDGVFANNGENQVCYGTGTDEVFNAQNCLKIEADGGTSHQVAVGELN